MYREPYSLSKQAESKKPNGKIVTFRSEGIIVAAMLGSLANLLAGQFDSLASLILHKTTG